MGAKQEILTAWTGEIASADWTRLLIGCRPEQYAASLLARAVEDCDAQLLNLNVSTPKALIHSDEEVDDEYPVKVELCVNHRSSESVRRSLERYGFTVLAWVSSEADDNSRAVQNYRHLMRYLEI